MNLKTRIFLILFLPIALNFFAQNLVPNYSFESFTLCPDNISSPNDDQVSRASEWFSCRGSADYFNSCSTNSNVSTPKNYVGFQKPYQGNAYTGIICLDQLDTNWHEIIGVKLISPLIVGKKYFVSIMANLVLDLNDGQYVVWTSSINSLGAKFSSTKFTMSSQCRIDNSSHIKAKINISDTLKWTKIFGSFTADSAYKYLMIGNFYDNWLSGVITYTQGTSPSIESYYFIDNVIVSTDSTYASSFVGIDQNVLDIKESKFYPNPFYNTFKIESDKGFKRYEIFNLSGEVLKQDFLMDNQFNEVELTGIEPGFYYIELINENGIKKKYKLLKQ
jgi:hypothetical protein